MCIQGLFEVGGGLGFAVGPIIGGVLYQLGGFRLPFVSVGGLVLLSVIPCFILVKSSGRSYKCKYMKSVWIIFNEFTDCSAQSLSLKIIWKLVTNFVIFVLGKVYDLYVHTNSIFYVHN